MRYYVVILLCYFIDFSAGAFLVESENESGYYWREFDGKKIPHDALPGGTNSDGVTTYIGQVYARNLVIPAKIDIVKGTVTYEWGYQEYHATEYIKILCARYPEQFQWLSSGNGYLSELKDKHLVRGGYGENADIYIGRIQLDDELALGKVFNNTYQSTLHIPKDGKGTQHAAFQILSYNPSISNRKDSNDCQVILCARYPEQFQWLSTGNGYISQLKGKHLIRGGYGENADIYIGRIQLDDELALGKVFNSTNQATLHIPKDGKGTQHAAFEVLSYNPSISNRTDSNDCQLVINP